jgi:serine/threonine protein kinase
MCSKVRFKPISLFFICLFQLVNVQPIIANTVNSSTTGSYPANSEVTPVVVTSSKTASQANSVTVTPAPASGSAAAVSRVSSIPTASASIPLLRTSSSISQKSESFDDMFEQAMKTLNAAQSPHKEKIRNFALHLGSREEFSDGEDQGAYTRTEFFAMAKNLVEFVETHREDMNKEYPNGSYYRSSHNDDLPFSLRVLPNGKLAVYLKSVLTPRDLKAKFEPLGKGGFKKVFLAIDYDLGVEPPSKSADDAFLAVGRIQLPKVIKQIHGGGYIEEVNEARRDDHYASALNEYALQKSLEGVEGVASCISAENHLSEKHPNSDRIDIIQKYYPTDLNRLIHEDPDFVRQHKNLLATDLLTGLAQLHAREIHHRDIKPENILIEYDASGRPRAKIADFGLALDLLQMSNQEIHEAGRAGTTRYMSPDYIRNHQARYTISANTDLKNDIWAMGIILNSIDQAGKWDFPRWMKERNAAHSIATHLSNPERISQAFNLHDYRQNYRLHDRMGDLIVDMLSAHPNQRPTAAQALSRLTSPPVPPVQHRLQARPFPVAAPPSIVVAPPCTRNRQPELGAMRTLLNLFICGNKNLKKTK